MLGMNSANFQNLSPVMFLQRAAVNFPKKIAFEDANSSKTYQQFFVDALTLGKELKKLGVEKHDRVAILYQNSYVSLLAHFALPILGASLVPINTRLDQKTIAYILSHTQSKVLITTSDFYNDLYKNIVDHVLINWGSSDAKYEEVEAFGDHHSIIDHIDENDVISINYTSGTSGTPKGVMCTHRGVYLNSLGECIQAKLNSASKYLWVLPMFHCNGWCFTWAVTAAAGTHVCIDKITALDIIDAICRYDITHFCAAPVILVMLMGSPEIYRIKDKKIIVITAGSSPSPNIINFFKNTNIELIHVYGLTETFGPHAICDVNYLPKTMSKDILHTQGVASIHGSYMRVVNKDMQQVPKDGISLGEVVVRGNNVMKGYYNDELSTAQSFQGGWFHTGDLAIVRPDGYIEIRDREKDIIISGGENISSVQVENVIATHPAVYLVAVLAKRHEKWGEVPVAIVEPFPGKTVLEKELIDYCRVRLPGFMCPKQVIIRRSIPLTSTGKIQKKLLREQMVEVLF